MLILNMQMTTANTNQNPFILGGFILSMDETFTDVDGDQPYCGEYTPKDSRETIYGTHIEETDLSEGDRIALWVSGHWHTGKISGINDGGLYGDEKIRITLELDGIHRDEHENLDSTTMQIVSQKDDDYKTDENGWKTADASIKLPNSEASTRKLLGVLGGFTKLE